MLIGPLIHGLSHYDVGGAPRAGNWPPPHRRSGTLRIEGRKPSVWECSQRLRIRITAKTKTLSIGTWPSRLPNFGSLVLCHVWMASDRRMCHS